MGKREGSKPCRRRHSAEFKARVVAASREAGVSVAAAALAHGLNANLLRKWIKATNERASVGNKGRIEGSLTERPLVVPVRVSPAACEASPEIRLDLQHGELTVQIAWPSAEAEALSKLLRELLR